MFAICSGWLEQREQNEPRPRVTGPERAKQRRVVNQELRSYRRGRANSSGEHGRRRAATCRVDHPPVVLAAAATAVADAFVRETAGAVFAAVRESSLAVTSFRQLVQICSAVASWPVRVRRIDSRPLGAGEAAKRSGREGGPGAPKGKGLSAAPAAPSRTGPGRCNPGGCNRARTAAAGSPPQEPLWRP